MYLANEQSQRGLLVIGDNPKQEQKYSNIVERMMYSVPNLFSHF